MVKPLLQSAAAMLLVLAQSTGGVAPAPGPERLRVQVLHRMPHDSAAFTEGLEAAGSELYESSGRAGRSWIAVGPAGAPPRARTALPGRLFGEGITVVGDRVWQLTWRDGVAIERDRDTLAERRRVSYRGEGWGLCFQAGGGQRRLVMSDGSNRLTFRDPGSFAVTGHVDVTRDGAPVQGLNELECTPDGTVWANVFPTDTMVRLDPTTGTVTATADVGGLYPDSERPSREATPNGIAAVPGTDEFLVTGKLWPHIFRVRFVS
ncbi:glutaminyl-peptide cyclotransferase [Streptomyces sp. NPDC056943]|uniref:glutaminyl-peptide cyclotransferase n=1 Tax=Streptomyces sp. NPDC056943 TaxID=3345971 RepID=UPI0036383664